MDSTQTLHTILARLYGEDRAPQILAELLTIIGSAANHSRPPLDTILSERDVMLITYGDQVSSRSKGDHSDTDEPPLRTLHRFLRDKLEGIVNSVHILPFYPYTSDDGFSVVDFYAVDPALGTWDDINALRADFRLMFDAVFNHISSQSAWFQAFLRGEAPYTDYFIAVDPSVDLSQVVRPRTHPLLTPFKTAQGEKHIWTTFSDDQIDLNFSNSAVLLDIVRVLLFYVQQGATFIRLDAIAFLWKIIGTSCLHLEETHLVIQLLRTILDMTVPETVLITETNVPHKENISYFGDGTNEAQLVYQFPLPPLTLHTMRTGDTTALTRWAASLESAGKQTTFFNFLASHDGIGVRPVTGILSDEEFEALITLTTEHGGFVSYRSLPNGGKSPYELNISYFDAITHPEITERQPEVAVQRFLVAQAIMLALAGVPGIYFHSLFGSRNWREGAIQSGHNRTINREKFNVDALRSELDDQRSIRRMVYDGFGRLLRVRTSEAAFHPLGGQEILNLHPALFALKRYSPNGDSCVLVLNNVTDQTIAVDLHAAVPDITSWVDLLNGEHHASGLSGRIEMRPYQIAWLKQQTPSAT